MEPVAAPDSTRLGAKALLLAIGGGALLVAVAITAALLIGGGGSGATTTFVVQAGTGERLDAGEPVDLMPAEVRLSVGDMLVIRNEDDRDYVIGPYFVRAGETVEQRFTQPQELVGACDLSDHGTFRVIVTGRPEQSVRLRS